MFFSKKNQKDADLEKIIKFIPDSPRAEQILDPPSPAYKCVPDWYKRLGKYITDVKCSRYPAKEATAGDTNFTAKACKPFFDAFTMGYVITLPTDVEAVDPEVYEARMIWDSNTNMVEAHSHLQLGELKAPEEFEASPYKWNFHWAIRAPKGYSLIYTHPFNRFDLPFHTTSGIVDSDTYGAPVNLPFFLRKDFMGKIPRGTPVAQVIPVKREDWNHTTETFSEYDTFEVERVKLYMGGGYTKMNWQPKRYR